MYTTFIKPTTEYDSLAGMDAVDTKWKKNKEKIKLNKNLFYIKWKCFNTKLTRSVS